jgi:MSHA biogenesis protein MshO
MATQRNQRGISLIELITVISILGVIGSVASVFIRGPIDAYVDSARRAALTDSADTAMRRITRDIRKALPNSVRIKNPEGLTDGYDVDECLEFIPTKTAGRYRASLPGNILDFVTATGDTSFNMLGLNSDLPADQRIEDGDWVAVYNLGARTVVGLDVTAYPYIYRGADAYKNANISQVGNVVDATCLEGAIDDCETAIAIGSKLFPETSGSKRFYVIPKDENIVSYACAFDSNDVGHLRRMVRNFNLDDLDDLDPSSDYCKSKGTSISGQTLVSTILASNVSSCKFEHDDSDLQRNEPVRLTITFADDSGESISLYHQVSENNWP